MNNLVPYISSEPPPIQNDNFECETYNTENFNTYRLDDSIMNIPNNSMDVDHYEDPINVMNTDFYQYNNYGNDNSLSGRNPAELYQYIEKVIDENNLRVDFTDSAGNNDEKSDNSFDGEFDDYIDSITCKKDSSENVSKSQIIDTQSEAITHCPKALETDVCISNALSDIDSYDLVDKCNELIVTDIVNSTPKLINSQTDYFFNKTTEQSDSKCEAQSDDFADFSLVTYSPKIVSINDISQNNPQINNDNNFDSNNDFDDDFEDFATFEQSSKNDFTEKLSLSENSAEKIHETVNNLLLNLLANFEYSESEMPLTSNILTLSNVSLYDSFISNQKLFDDFGLLVWKELTNYDYSPAFVFQWMQSATYEKFMSSIGPEYREMLSSHRATLPLYSVNLNPIEPILLDSYLTQSNPSASSSSNDLASNDITIASCGASEKVSNIDFKDLEEEFIFDQFSNQPIEARTSSTDSDVVSAVPPALVQSERFGGILKSFLKPLSGPSGKSDSSSIRTSGPLAEAVLNELPDLSYMSAKVLMFPVLSAGCDVEDNI